MTTRNALTLAFLALCAPACAGCSSGFGWWGNKQAALNNPSVSSIAQQPAKPSWGSSITEAFTFKPKVIPADDPLTVTGKQRPVGADVYLSTARLHETRGDFEAAGAQYRKALEASPKSLPALVGYARLQDRQNKFSEAESLYQKALAAHPQSASVYNDLGLCQARHNRPEEALGSFQAAVEMEPANKLYRNNMAAVLVDMGRSKEAFEHLSQAHGEAVAHYNLGYLFYQRKKQEQATQHFTLAVEKDPSLAQARDMLKRLNVRPSDELVQQTQHVAKEPQEKAATLQRLPGNVQVSPAVPFDPREAGMSAPAQPRKLPAPAASSSSPQTSAVSPASVSVEELPAHSFPAIRLPEVLDQEFEERTEPAPLPDANLNLPGVKQRR